MKVCNSKMKKIDKTKLFGLLYILGNIFNVIGTVFNVVYRTTKEIEFEIITGVFLILAVIFIFVFGILWIVQLYKESNTYGKR